MKTTTLTRLRQNLARVMDDIAQDREPIVVTRAGAEPAVMMSLDDYNTLTEMVHLASSGANAERLSEAIEQLNRGGGSERTLVE